MKPQLKRLLFILATIPFLIVGAAMLMFSGRAELVPNGETYAQWEVQFGKPSGKIARFVKDGAVYYEVIGDYPKSFFAMPSGPPAYIFDRTGRLVDWCADTGEASEYNTRWRVRELRADPIDYTAFTRLIRHKPAE